MSKTIDVNDSSNGVIMVLECAVRNDSSDGPTMY